MEYLLLCKNVNSSHQLLPPIKDGDHFVLNPGNLCPEVIRIWVTIHLRYPTRVTEATQMLER